MNIPFRTPFGRLGLVLLLSCFSLSIATADWFRWRGPNLDGISDETGWTTQWPQEGPPLLWKASVGTGFSSVTVANQRVYTMGNSNSADTVFCFDAATGHTMWQFSYPCGLRPQYYEGGTSATPTVDGNRIYSLGKEGQLFCFNANDGEVLWKKDLTKEVGAIMPRWGFAGSALIINDLVVLNAGSSGTAFDKNSGALRWSSGVSNAGYATPVPIAFSGKQFALIFGAKALNCVAVSDGKLAWSYPLTTRWDLNIADPIVRGDRVFLSTFDQGALLLKVTADGAVEIWHNQNLANHFNGSILYDGYLYGIHGNTDKPPADLRCLSFDTGEVKWHHSEFGFGALTIAAGKIILISDRGELVTAPATPTEFKPISRAQVMGGKCWITPVLANGKIYCRNAQGTLVCLDVQKRQGTP